MKLRVTNTETGEMWEGYNSNHVWNELSFNIKKTDPDYQLASSDTECLLHDQEDKQWYLLDELGQWAYLPAIYEVTVLEAKDQNTFDFIKCRLDDLKRQQVELAKIGQDVDRHKQITFAIQQLEVVRAYITTELKADLCEDRLTILQAWRKWKYNMFRNSETENWLGEEIANNMWHNETEFIKELNEDPTKVIVRGRKEGWLP